MTNDQGRYGSSADGVADVGDDSGHDAQGGSETSSADPSGSASGAGPASGMAGSAGRRAPSRPGGRNSPFAKASSGAAGSGSGSSAGGNGGGLGGGASQPGQPGGMGMPNLTMGQPPQSVAHERGRNWANQGANDEYAKEAVVPIKLICDADHLALVPERGSGREIRVIKLRERTADSVNELVDAVWDQVDSWGTAGRGNYWRPKLVLEIEPGGEQRFADLKALLKDSGFDIDGRPRTPPKPKRPGRAKPKGRRQALGVRR